MGKDSIAVSSGVPVSPADCAELARMNQIREHLATLIGDEPISIVGPILAEALFEVALEFADGNAAAAIDLVDASIVGARENRVTDQTEDGGDTQ